jgi:hypothetical protein
MLSRQVLNGGRRAYTRSTAATRMWMPHVGGFGDDSKEQQQPSALTASSPLTVQRRSVHVTAKQDSALILLGGVGLAVAFVGLHYISEGISVIQARRAEGQPIFARSKCVTGGGCCSSFRVTVRQWASAAVVMLRANARMKRPVCVCLCVVLSCVCVRVRACRCVPMSVVPSRLLPDLRFVSSLSGAKPMQSVHLTAIFSFSFTLSPLSPPSRSLRLAPCHSLPRCLFCCAPTR